MSLKRLCRWNFGVGLVKQEKVHIKDLIAFLLAERMIFLNINALKEKLENAVMSVNSFQSNQKKWKDFFDNINNTFCQDFSILLKQDTVNTLLEIHQKKEDVLMANLLLLTAFKEYDSVIAKETIIELEKIRVWSGQVANLNFGQQVIGYCAEVNKAITFFKTPEGQVFENQLVEAEKLLVWWKNTISYYNLILLNMNEIKKSLDLISGIELFQK